MIPILISSCNIFLYNPDFLNFTNLNPSIPLHFIEEKFGADNVISAVMHADEINVAATEELGKEVYHYHLHAIVKN